MLAGPDSVQKVLRVLVLDSIQKHVYREKEAEVKQDNKPVCKSQSQTGFSCLGRFAVFVQSYLTKTQPLSVLLSAHR